MFDRLRRWAFAGKGGTDAVVSPEKFTQEQTGAQQTKKGNVQGFRGDAPGYAAPPAGNFDTYRAMRNDPSIALARTVATAPLQLANWSFEEKDAPSDARDFIADHLEIFHARLMRNICYALDYGFQAFEKVVTTLPDGHWGYRKIKPLIPDDTEIVQDKDTGAFQGLKQGKVELIVDQSFLYTYDREGTNRYGRSRHENIREHVWPATVGLLHREGQYVRKAAGTTPIIEYPDGESEDANGRKVSNFELAEKLLRHLGSGNGVSMPKQVAGWAEQLHDLGVTNIDALKAWTITFLETRSLHGYEMAALAKRYDALKFRGWLVPERVATEGQHGTKAEAVAHVDVALMVAELLLRDIAEHINWYLINPLLLWNYGPGTVGRVWLEPERLINEQKAVLRDIMKQVLSSNADLTLELLDQDAAIELLGLPKSAEANTLITGKGSKEDQDALLKRIASLGNDVTLEDARAFAAIGRYKYFLAQAA